MKPNLLSVTAAGILLAAVAPNVTAQSEAPSKGPKLVVKERTIDLGRMQQGDKATARFTLENGGDSNLIIERVNASCGCTIPEKLNDEQRQVKPGETVEIIVQFDSMGRVGKQRKAITVTSNDPLEPRLKLYLTAEIVTLFEVLIKGRPAKRTSFGLLRPGQDIEEVVELLPTEPGLALELESVELMTAALTHTTGPMTRDNRTGVRVKLKVDPDATIGRVMTRLVVTARVGEKKATASLAIDGTVVGLLEFNPVQIKQLSPILPGNALTPVKVSSFDRKPFDILSAEAGPNIDVTIDQNDIFDYTLKLRIRESAAPGPFGAFLDVRTNVVDQPLIRIPVFARVQPLVTVQPPLVVLYAGKDAKSQRIVKIESTAYTALELGAIETNQPYVTARVVAAEGRKSKAIKHLLIEVTGEPPLGILSAQVRVRTNIEGQPEVLIPVTLIAETK